ncbi:MAG: hypothetical protein E7B59_12580 [Enterobacteriaceae bacterium]|nr:hypothetical protein [Enterobacteriaceae bacterium]
METKEWVDKLRGLPDDAIIQLHFKLQDDIKRYYKLREEDNNLELAIMYCEQQIALAELTMPAMKSKHRREAAEYKKITGMKSPVVFYAPAHHGYRQLIVILKRRGDQQRISELRRKRNREGWHE